MDTTSLSFYGEGGETLGEHGYSKDYRPDLRQMILALIVDGAGRPICTEMWPGNTADVTTLLPVVDRLRRRFSVGRVCAVADRGMISAATIEGLEARKLEYILGARERSDAIVRKIVLENQDPFTPLLVDRKAGETQLFVKQVKVEGKRYIVCRNEAEAEKERKDREAIVAAIDAQLKKGDKALIGNSAYRRYLRKAGKAKDNRSFEISTPPSAAMCSVLSWPSRCKSISTTCCMKRALRQNGRSCCAISTGCRLPVSITTEPIGWCVRTPAETSPPCSARRRSHYRRAPNKPRLRPPPRH